MAYQHVGQIGTT